MDYTIEVEPAANRQLRRLPREMQPRIASAIDGLAAAPRPPDAQAIQGWRDTYRIRVGDYRVVYEVHDDRVVVLVVLVGHRREVYQQLRRRR